jgi:hypothetical protein
MADINDLAKPWNSGATVFHGIKLNVTDTTSAATSRLFTFQVGGTDKIHALKTGALVSASTLTAAGLVLSSGGTINFDSSNVVLTHSTGILTVSTGDLRVTTAGTDDDSVVTVGGTQTLYNKTIAGVTDLLTAGVVGSYMFAVPNNEVGSIEYVPGDTLAGSSLEPYGINGDGDGGSTGGFAMSGTWQSMGNSRADEDEPGIYIYYGSLWIRTV